MRERMGLAGRRVERGIWVLGLLALLGSVLAGCGGGGGGQRASGDSGSEPQRGGKVAYGLSQDMDGFNPASSRLASSGLNVAKAIYDPIAVLNPEGVAEPYLVEAIDHNEDFTEWTLTTRDGITFHNGDPLTPQVLATHLKSMQLAPLTFFTFKPVSAVGVVDEAARPQFEAGELSQEEYDVQRRQVRVFMSEPWSTFPAFLAGFQVGYVAHPDYVDGQIEEPIGTGPFVLDEWVPGDHATVTRNDSYWREGLPYLDEIEFKVMIDPKTRLTALETGDVDLIGTNAVGQVVELSTDEQMTENYQFIEDQGAGDEMSVMLNTQSGPAADLEVRQALALATDRAALNTQLYGDFYELADTPYHSDSPWYSDPGWPEPDLGEAKDLVEAWEADNGALSIELTLQTSQDDLELGQIVAAQWAEAGIDTEIKSIDTTAAAQVLPVGDFEAYLFQFYNGADPDEHYPFWDPDPENIGGPGELSINFARYTSPTVQDALHEARRTGDPDARAAEYAKVWKDWAENFPYLWLFHTQWLIIATPEVQGLESFTLPDGRPAAGHVWGSIFLTEAWVAD